MSQVERPDEPPRSDLLKREPLGVSVFPLVERVVGDRGTHDLDAGAGQPGFIEARTLRDSRSGRLVGMARWEDEASWRAGRAEAVHRGDQVLFLARLGSVDRHVDDHLAAPLWCIARASRPPAPDEPSRPTRPAAAARPARA